MPHVVGRDVEKADYAVSFEPSTALLMQLLRDNPGQKPAQLATALQSAPAKAKPSD